jgi:hypothetical protein
VFYFYFRVIKIVQEEKFKGRPQALNTIEMLRAASSGLGILHVKSILLI